MTLPIKTWEKGQSLSQFPHTHLISRNFDEKGSGGQVTREIDEMKVCLRKRLRNNIKKKEKEENKARSEKFFIITKHFSYQFVAQVSFHFLSALALAKE